MSSLKQTLVLLNCIFLALLVLVNSPARAFNTEEYLSSNGVPILQQSLMKLFETSHAHYSKSTLQNYTAHLEESFNKRDSLQTTIESGSWFLGDLTVFSSDCVQTIIPLTQMSSSGSTISISHQLASTGFYISTIIKRPLSSLYNGILSSNGDSIPICFNFQSGKLAFTSDFLLCSSVDTFAPTCQKAGDTVYNIALLYDSPGTRSNVIVAILAFGCIGVLACLVCCCICCIVCLTKSTRASANNRNYGQL